MGIFLLSSYIDEFLSNGLWDVDVNVVEIALYGTSAAWPNPHFY